MSQHLLVAFAWSNNNIGDIGITPGLLSLFRKHDTTTPVCVIASQTETDEAYRFWQSYLMDRYDGCRAIANPIKSRMGEPREFIDDDTTAWGRFCRRWGQQKLDAFARGCLATDLAAAIAEDLLTQFASDFYHDLTRRSPEAAAALTNAGFLLFNSGTVFNFGRLQVRDFWTYALHFAMPLLLARRLKIPYGINGHSYDAIDWPADLVLRPVFHDAAFVFSRDSDSAQYLRQRDMSNVNGGFRPDSTFFFESDETAWAKQFMAEHDLHDRGFLALTTRHVKAQYDADASWDKVGGDPVAGAVTPERQAQQMGKFIELIEHWTQQTDLPVVLCPETRTSVDEMQQHLRMQLSERARQQCILVQPFWTTDQAYSLYRHARISVSMEMHTTIMAMQVGTPAMHVPFREAGRKARMVADLGLGDWLLDIDEVTADDLCATADRIHGDYPNALSRMQLVMPHVQELGDDVIRRVQKHWRVSKRSSLAI